MMNADILKTAAEFKELLVGRATGSNQDTLDVRLYGKLRNELLDDPAVASKLPEFVASCRSLDEFWSFIKSSFPKYEERRNFLSTSFSPLFLFLEDSRRTKTKSPAAERLVAKASQVLMCRGAAREVAILYRSMATIAECGEGWNEWMELELGLPPKFYTQLDDGERKRCEESITKAVQELNDEPDIRDTNIRIGAEARDNWREIAANWLRGEGINNQGRVRSTNLPSREVDGLLFRSQPEVFVYQALKQRGVTFAPLPVFLRGGQQYQRIEPDFIVFVQGKILLIEVDGDTVHVETPAEADRRTRMFKLEGAFIERISASECDSESKANSRVATLLTDFEKWRRQK